MEGQMGRQEGSLARGGMLLTNIRARLAVHNLGLSFILSQ